MTEKIIEGEEFRKGVKTGINKLANTVKDTLGPMGRTVVIKNAFGEHIITKDGVTVAEEIFLPTDTIESIGSNMVKEVALKANSLAGDGTTTATVLSQAIYNEGSKQLSLGILANDFKVGIKSASIDVLREIRKTKIDVTTESPELKSVALISSNGDEDIAKTVTKVYKELGKNAVVSVKQGNGIETEVNIVKGMQFDSGYMSPYCVTDRVKMKADFENAFVFLYDGKLKLFKRLVAAVEFAGQNNRPLIVVAENVDETALRGLAENHLRGNVRSAIVMSPGHGKKRVSRLEDMAILFGGKVLDKNTDTLENFNPAWLGEVDRVEITSRDTAFIGGHGDQTEIDERANFMESQLEHFKGNKYETDKLNERLGKLTGGVAVIKVGALSREEAKEILDRVEDCKHAVKAALEEGIIEGGGMAFYNAATLLENNEFKADIPEGVLAGYKALLNAIKEPFRQILRNASIIPDVIEAELKRLPLGSGYDVKKGEFVATMIDGGIIDPFKVDRIALESSVSIVSTLLTSNYAVINKDDTTTTTFR